MCFFTWGSYAQKIHLKPAFLKDILVDYKYLHQNPELSFMEKETASFLAKKMNQLGFTVTEQVGGHGLVCVLKNGPGETIMLRADIDALPVKEETNLPYSSKKTMKDDKGDLVHVMHACGHDIHMAVWLGTARYLVENRKNWKGTLVFIAQPAEERSGGAKHMLKDGLYEKFPLPNYVLSLHANANLPAGKVGWKEEYAMANVDMMRIVIHGKGGHGAYPHSTIDPVALSARLILDLQTIVSREISPLEPAVVTVGSIHGGTKGNVIPNEVELELTMRSYSDEVRNQIIEAIERKCKALAISAGLPKELYPTIELRDEFTPSLYNDIQLTSQIVRSMESEIGKENVVAVDAVMAGEDFGRYGRTKEDIPIVLYWLGAVNKEEYKRAKEAGKKLPSLHNSGFAPDAQPTIQTGIRTMSRSVLDLLNK